MGGCQEEDIQGKPFVGKSGKLLDKLIDQEMGMSRDEIYITNVIKCRPPQNRNPMQDEIELCRHFLFDQLKYINPRVIVTLGNFAAQLLLNTKTGINQLRTKIYNIDLGFLTPTFHPAYALRGGPTIVAKMRADLARAKELLNSSEL